MHDDLARLHTETYDAMADEYESRVEILRPITEYALSFLIEELKPGAKVLDIGCAVGYTMEILRGAGLDAEGIDISPKMVSYAKMRNPTSTINTGDFLTEPYEPASYDAALLYAFIHLFPTAVAINGIHKASSILKPGGLLFVGTTKSETPVEGLDAKHDYKVQAQRFRKRWTSAELEDVLMAEGLDIIHHEDIEDEYGKIWMDYLTRKRSQV